MRSFSVFDDSYRSSMHDAELARRRLAGERRFDDRFDVRILRTFGEMRAQRGERGVGAPGAGLDVAVRQVAHPTLQAESARPHLDEEAKADALHAAAHQVATAVHFGHP